MYKRLDIDIPALTEAPDILNLTSSLDDLPSLSSILPSIQSLGTESLSKLKNATEMATLGTHGGISPGAIGGIVAGVVAAIALPAILWFLRRRRRRRQRNQERSQIAVTHL